MRAVAITLTLAIASPALADSGDEYDNATMGLQLAGGIGGAVVGGVALGLACGLPNKGMGAVAGAAVCGTAGAIIGNVLGVTLVGDARDATGGYLGSSLGMLGGALIVGGVGTVVGEIAGQDRVPIPIVLALGTLGIVGGTVIGYQIQNSGPEATATERRVMLALPALRF